MSKHTPGPWKSVNNPKRGSLPDEPRCITTKDGCLALVYRDDDGVFADPVGESNANLIAASPDLLAFIRRWRGIIVGGDKLDIIEGWAREFVEEADAAIAKAGAA